MTEIIRDKLISLFWEGIADYSWEDWCSLSAGDKEDLVADAIVDLNEIVDADEAYDLFWEWADGLEEDSFIDFDSFEDKE